MCVQACTNAGHVLESWFVLCVLGSDDARTKPVLSLLWGERFPKYVMVPGDTLLLDFHAASVDEEESKRWGFRASITGHRLPVRALQVFHAYRDITAFCGRIAVEMMSGEELAHDFLDSNLRLDIFSGGLEHHMFGSRGVDSDHPLIDFRTPECRCLSVCVSQAKHMYECVYVCLRVLCCRYLLVFDLLVASSSSFSRGGSRSVS